MGLLDDLPYGLLNQIWNGTQSQTPVANSSAGYANDLPPWTQRQPQRAPLSFAGPDLTADVASASPSRARATVTLSRAAEASAATDLSWLPRNRSADVLRAQPPAPPAQNLTMQALRMKGVSDADIAAATGNPEMIKQLIIQNYSPVSALAPVRNGYPSYDGRASGGSFGDARQRIYLGSSGLDETGTRPDAPVWGRVNPISKTDHTGLTKEHANNEHEQCIAKCSDLALPTEDFGIQFRRCVLACLSGGNSGFPEWDRHFP